MRPSCSEGFASPSVIGRVASKSGLGSVAWNCAVGGEAHQAAGRQVFNRLLTRLVLERQQQVDGAARRLPPVLRQIAGDRVEEQQFTVGRQVVGLRGQAFGAHQRRVEHLSDTRGSSQKRCSFMSIWG